jgi:hypothetical protein
VFTVIRLGFFRLNSQNQAKDGMLQGKRVTYIGNTFCLIDIAEYDPLITINC